MKKVNYPSPKGKGLPPMTHERIWFMKPEYSEKKIVICKGMVDEKDGDVVVFVDDKVHSVKELFADKLGQEVEIKFTEV